MKVIIKYHNISKTFPVQFHFKEAHLGHLNTWKYFQRFHKFLNSWK